MELPNPLSMTFWRSRKLPVVLQTEAAECGLACLAMVASYWGHRFNLSDIRRRFSVSMKGVSLKSLIGIAGALKLQSRAVKLPLQGLAQLTLPCILHWDMNHFVVLKSVLPSRIVVHDPMIGERSFSLEEASRRFTGVALELTPTNEFRAADERKIFTLRSLMGRIVGLRRGLGQLVLLGLCMQVCALVAPFYLQWIVDEAIVSADRDLVTVLGLGFLLLVLIQNAMSAVRSWVTSTLAATLNFQWLRNAFGHLMQLPLPFFEKRHLGDIVSRFGSIQAIQQSLTTQFVEGVIDGMLVISTFVVMLLYSPKLAFVALVAVALYAVTRLVLFAPLRDSSAERIVHAAKQQTHFLESARGVQSVRLFGRADERRTGWSNLLADQLNAELRIARIAISYQTANTLIFNVERVLVIWMAALAVMEHQFSVGMLFAFIGYKDQFSQRMASLIDKLFDLRMLRLHGDRVADILHAPVEADSLEVEASAEELVPSIELRGVSFRYADDEPWILKDVHLAIPAGQCVAVVGPSGAGKTTLVKLILGLLKPTQGEILIGGIPLPSLGVGNFRRVVGSVMQEDTLFSGSIADNICFFDPSPDQARIVASGQAAAVHAEILSMPMGYGTLIGDIGSGLSGGQKQRILLARALYRQPRMLVLDEATSHLDLWNEQLVNAAIRQVQLTRVIVAHRPETIAMAERVAVFEKGALVREFLQTQRGCKASEAGHEVVAADAPVAT